MPTEETFGDISNERQWEWDRELEVLWDFIEERGLGGQVVTFARRAADDEQRDELVDQFDSLVAQLQASPSDQQTMLINASMIEILADFVNITRPPVDEASA